MVIYEKVPWYEAIVRCVRDGVRIRVHGSSTEFEFRNGSMWFNLRKPENVWRKTGEAGFCWLSLNGSSLENDWQIIEKTVVNEVPASFSDSTVEVRQQVFMTKAFALMAEGKILIGPSGKKWADCRGEPVIVDPDGGCMYPTAKEWAGEEVGGKWTVYGRKE